MYRKAITPQQIVDYLNHLLKIDYEAIEKLCFSRVFCNKAMADHPTVQVDACGNTYQVGLLGILNGLVGTDEESFGCLCGDVDDTGKIKKFRLLKNRMRNNMK